MATSPSPALPDRRRGRHNWNTQPEPRPQPPCSPASPDPSPTGDGARGLLPPGTKVEVRLNGKGYYGIWFEAIIVDYNATHGRHVPARYSVTFDGDGDLKRFAPTHVRPRPPALVSPPPFRPHDVVEVFHERGWWSGLVLSADPRSVTVAFPITREVITYMPHLVRPRRDFVDGDWVPSQAVVTVRPDREIRRYEVGDKVEVVTEREAYGHSWFPAKVGKVIDEFSYIVEYSDQNGEEGGGSEYLHWQFIRPAVQHLPPENEFHLHLGPGTAVEAYCDGAWSAGLVHRIHEDGKFVVRINGRQRKQLMTKDVKPQYEWDGMDWSIVSTKVQNQSKRKQAPLRKVFSSKKRLSQKNEGFEGPHSLHGPLELPATGQMIGVHEIAGSQREPSLVLERSESTQQQLYSTLENAVNANEVKYQGPVGVVPLISTSTSDGIGIHGGKSDEGLTAQDNRITDVLTNNSHTQAPFVSCLSSTVEDMDVLKEFPQQPHFLPLQHYPETIQKGMKLGLKVAFNDCMGRIRKSSIADNEGSFEEKKSTLAELKKNGFDVQYVECLLEKLIKVKDEYNKHLEEKSAVQAEHQRTMSSLSRNDSLLHEKENDIAELEKKLGFLCREAQHIEKEREHDEENLSRLKDVQSNIKEELDNDVRKFNAILAEAQQKRLN